VTGRAAHKRIGIEMITSYMLARMLPAKDRYVYANVKTFAEVKDVILTYGKYDLILKIESDSFEALDDFVFNKLRMIDGIISTSTLLEAKLEVMGAGAYFRWRKGSPARKF